MASITPLPAASTPFIPRSNASASGIPKPGAFMGKDVNIQALQPITPNLAPNLAPNSAPTSNPTTTPLSLRSAQVTSPDPQLQRHLHQLADD